MPGWLRFVDWPLRAKLVLLLAAASLIPLGIVTWISLGNARQSQLTNSANLLAARADDLVGRIDTFNRGYQRAVNRMALIPSALALLQAKGAEAARIELTLRSQLQVWPATDSGIRGVAVLDASGNVVTGTEERLRGKNLAYRGFVKQALRGAPVISDVFIDVPEVGGAPTIAFLSPMRDQAGEVLGAAAFWVQASALTDVLKQSNEMAGPGSFAILFDHLGIRIAHSFLEEMVFHPGVELAPLMIDELVAERRFGDNTRALLEDVRAVSPEFALATDAGPGRPMFRGFAPGNAQWNYAVGRPCTTVGWTAYFLIPESVPHAVVASIVRQRLLIVAVIAVVAVLVGGMFAAMIVRPIQLLSSGARRLGAGDLSARVRIERRDELGELGAAFNTMAERIQQQSAALLKESEDRYQGLIESQMEGFCRIQLVFDAAGKPVDFRFLEVNPAFERQSGLKDVIGRSISEIRPVEPHWYEMYGRIATTGEPVHVENYSPAIGRWFDLRAYRVGKPEERQVAILFNDITERRNAKLRLEEQLERLNLLQQITHAIGERHDMASIYQVVIRTLEDRLPIDFGCVCTYAAPDQHLTVVCVGSKSRDLAVQMGMTEQAIVEIDANGLSRCVRGELVCEPDVSQVQFPFPQRLARAGLRALVAAPLLVESKVFGVLIAAHRDVDSFGSGECEFLKQLSEHVALAAHQAQLYVALQTAYEELRQTQQAAMQQERLRALGQMSSGIAHDINNAMSPAALYADSLLEKETGLTPSGREKLETILRAIHDVAATVARIREFYRPRESQSELAPVQLNELVQQVLHLTRVRWSDMPQQRGITIENRLELAPDLPPVMAMESEIREALTNLIFNAVDAMPEGGTLTLRTRRDRGSRVLVEVIDTGVGMDEDARRRCLEPFFTTKGERGTGLGLAMVYGVLQRHGAGIEIDSAPGAGTTMRLSFAVAPTGTGTTQPQTPVVPTGLHILVVDDDPVLLRSLREALEGDGHMVTIANGGQEGIDLFQAAARRGLAFNAVMTDLGMPYVDGRQVAAAVKQAAAATPVIMLTGWGQRLVADGEIPADVDLVLSKPPKLRDLRQALARLCSAART
jgi:PAS domain S-box-containing protein